MHAPTNAVLAGPPHKTFAKSDAIPRVADLVGGTQCVADLSIADSRFYIRTPDAIS